jgi:serine/threonine protein phosphatase PrpC
VIYRTVGDKAKVELEISTLTLKIGDYILLCSDGMSGYVEDRAIHRIILEAPSPQAACDALIDAANAGGGDDNISAVLVKIVQA